MLAEIAERLKQQVDISLELIEQRSNKKMY